MQKLLLFTTLSILILFNTTAYSKKIDPYGKKTNVGLQPIAIIPENEDTLNIICMGLDANYNGVFDEGDEYPSWWKITNIINAHPEIGKELKSEKIMNFPGNWMGLFPYRCQYANMICIPLEKCILTYNLTTTKFIDTIKIAGCKALSEDETNIYISVREYENPGDYISIANYVVIYNKQTKSVDTINTGYNIQRTIPYINKLNNKKVLAALCEGANGEPSFVEFYDINTKELLGKVDIGLFGNDIKLVNISNIVNAQIILAVVNGSHKIQAIDAQLYTDKIPLLETLGLPSNIALPTAGFDGPREIAGNEQMEFYITAYNGKVYKLNFLEQSIDSLEAEGTPEALYVAPSNANSYVNFVYGNIYGAVGSYIASNEIYIEYLPKNTIREFNAVSFNYYPSPVQNFVTVKSDENTVKNIISMALFDVNGNLVQQLDFVKAADNSLSFTINPNISSGTYLVMLQTKTNTSLFKLIKE